MKRIDNGEARINLNKNELIERYVSPYLSGETIVINGTTVSPKNLWRVKITSSEKPLDEIVKRIEREDERDPSPYAIFNSSASWRAIDEATDVTEQYINKPPGRIKNQSAPANLSKNSNKVFVVHGHDTELKNDVEIFLKGINLEPIVLHRQLDEGLTVIEKFEKHSDVNFAIILLTPDDIGYTAEEGKKKEEDRTIEFRARQNVIFEFGFFVGKLSRKNVCCIYKEGVTLPSDLSGLIYKKVNKSVEEVGMFLMRELKNAGLQVKFE
jgi:predicted nucleotide-binding protein